jgi:predicted nucleotidyltransferase
MGRTAAGHISLSSALFANVRQRVLALIFGHPQRSFYTAEIIKKVNSGTGAVERELSRLRHSGLVSVQRIGNQKHYQANRESPIFQELHGLVLKTAGLAEPLAESLKQHADSIKAAFVYGSVAKGTDTTHSDIDLIVIGEDLDYPELYAGAQQAEAKLHRPVKPLFLSSDDWKRKRAQKNSFVHKISMQPKIFIFGSEADLHP